MRLRDGLFLLAIVVAAALLGATGAPTILVAPFGLASFAITVRLLAVLSFGEPLRRWVLAIAMTITAVIAMGFLLDALPWGLTRAAWSIAWGLAAAAVLGFAAWRDVDPGTWVPQFDDTAEHAFVVLGAGALVFAAGLAIAYRASSNAMTAPAEISIQSVSSSNVSIAVTTAKAGPVRLVEERGDHEVSVWSSDYLSGGATAHVLVPFPSARTTIALDGSAPADHRPEVILDPTALQRILGARCDPTDVSASPVVRAAACAYADTAHAAP
jgi:hypothetical protein